MSRTPELHDAPDYAEPLVAWRVWRVVSTSDGFRLGSVVKSALWPAGEPLRAECLREPTLAGFFRRRAPSHGAPEPECECGIYAGRLSAIEDYLAPSAAEFEARALGQVLLWGRVVECERGFRASYAYPARLYLPAGGAAGSARRRERLVAELGAYGVPVDALDIPASEARRRLERIAGDAAA